MGRDALGEEGTSVGEGTTLGKRTTREGNYWERELQGRTTTEEEQSLGNAIRKLQRKAPLGIENFRHRDPLGKATSLGKRTTGKGNCRERELQEKSNLWAMPYVIHRNLLWQRDLLEKGTSAKKNFTGKENYWRKKS